MESFAATCYLPSPSDFIFALHLVFFIVLVENIDIIWRRSGWERTLACADACTLLVQARCLERGARRVLAAPAAPRAARSLRLALDYAFTDALHDQKLVSHKYCSL